MAYTGEGFGQLAQFHLLPTWLRPRVVEEVPTGLFPAPGRLAQSSLDPGLQSVFLPLFGWVAERCVRLRWLQQGKLPIYLLYIFICCGLLMVWSILEGRG